MSWFSVAAPTLIPSIANGIAGVIKGIFGLKDKQAEIILEGIKTVGNIAPAAATELQSIAAIVQAEASSEHWLTASWRPIVMMLLVIPVVLNAFGQIHMDAEQLKFHYTTVEIGLAGYVGARTVEKVTRTALFNRLIQSYVDKKVL